MSGSELQLDMKVDEIAHHLNQLRELGYVLGVDFELGAFVVAAKTGDPTTHYITYDEEEGTLNWKRSNE